MIEIEQVYRAYFSDVYRYALSLTHDRALAEDITQETFYKAMKAIDGFKGDCSVKVWLCQIAKNTFLSHKRKEKNPALNIDEVTVPDSRNLERSVVHKEQVREIMTILWAMEDPYRAVFNMRYFADMSFAMIGHLQGKSESWARVTYHRARKKIMEKING